MPRLRHIAVHVEEPQPGRFAWVLSERGDQGFEELDRARAVVASYRQAMADGLLALQARVPDLDIGPRSTDEDADDSADESADHAPAAAQRGKSYFGFGPAR